MCLPLLAIKKNGRPEDLPQATPIGVPKSDFIHPCEALG